MKTIEEKLLIEVIALFDKKANEMILILAEEFKLDLNHPTPFSKLLFRKNNLWSGNLRNEWKYHFHGDACDFENLQTKQFLHVKINRDSNYGAIDNFYLFRFMQTTESLKRNWEILNSENVFYETLSILEKNQIVLNVGNYPTRTKILNKQYAA